MGAITRLSFEEFEKLPEREGVRYELDEGELLMEPSTTYLHNRIRDKIARRLSDFVEKKVLGEVISEMDFRLGSATVRNPDAAFVTTEQLRDIDVTRTPVLDIRDRSSSVIALYLQVPWVDPKERV